MAEYCYGLNCAPQFTVRALIPKVTVLGDGALKEVIGVHGVHKRGALTLWDCCPYRKRHQACLSLSTMSGHCKKTAIYKPGGEFSPETNPWLASWSWIPSPQNCKKIKFCCLSYLCSVAQPCLTLCDAIDCSPPGSSIHGISQARILEWVAISSSRGFSQLKDQTCVSCISCIGRQILYHWANFTPISDNPG